MTHRSPPQTLFQIAGAPSHPSPWDRSVVVVVDAQNEYVDGSLPLSGIAPAIAETARLIAAARGRGCPVVHVVHHAAVGAPVFDPASRFAAIIPALAPMEGEDVVVKTLPNAFTGTALAARLAARTGRPEMILAGFMTHMCISATARGALDLGIRTTIVAGATATRDLPDPLGGTVPAAVVQRAALAGLADRFAIVVADTKALSPA